MDGLLDALTSAMPASYLAGVVLISVLAQLLAWHLRIPSILLLLLAGFSLGLVVDATSVMEQDILYAGVSLTVGIILFEGSLSLKIRQVRDLGQSVLRLCTLTVVIAAPLIALSAWVAGVEPRLAVLLGALLVVTGPTVINPIVRQLRPTRRAAALLRWEGIIVDPIGAVLATLVLQAVIGAGTSPLEAAVRGLLMTVALGVGLGVGAGHLLRLAMRRHLIPDFLQGVVFLAVALAVFAASNAVASESGLLTVTVLGVYLANSSDIHLHRVVEFTEHLQVLFVGSLFVLLGGLVSWEEITAVAPQAAIFIALLVLVVRPLSIYLSLRGSDSDSRERTLLAFMAPRGIVAAAVTSIFALEIGHRAHQVQEDARMARFEGSPDTDALSARAEDLAALAAEAESLVPLVFLVVVGTVTIYGLGVGRLAERLGLASTSPQGVLFAGSAPWVIDAGEQLKELGVPVRVVSHVYTGIRAARQRGLETYYGHILADITSDELDPSGMGHLLAVTADDEMNSTVAREYSSLFGSANTYQLRPGRRGDDVEQAATERPVGRETGLRAGPDLRRDQRAPRARHAGPAHPAVQGVHRRGLRRPIRRRRGRPLPRLHLGQGERRPAGLGPPRDRDARHRPAPAAHPGAVTPPSSPPSPDRRRNARSRGRPFVEPSVGGQRLICMTTALGSVKNSRLKSPPSRPTPESPTPPKGVRRSRMKKQLTQTVPALSLLLTRCAVERFSVKSIALRP